MRAITVDLHEWGTRQRGNLLYRIGNHLLFYCCLWSKSCFGGTYFMDVFLTFFLEKR